MTTGSTAGSSRSGPSTRAVFALAWPMAMNAILLQGILIIDTLLVAPLGEASLAAMGLAASIVAIVLGVIFAFANGTQLLAAQAEGAANGPALGAAFWSGLLINGVIAAIGTVLILTFGRPVLDTLSQTPAMGRLAWDYIAWFTLVIAGVALCQNITVTLYATGRSRLPLYGNLLELPVNALLSYALINGAWGFPLLGLSGAAIGSAVAVGLRAAFLLAVLRFLKPDFARFPWASVRTARRAVRHHVDNALPIAGTFISATLSLQVCMLVYAQLPIRQFALLTLLLPWMKVATHAATAWAQGTGIQVGQLLGRDAMEALDEFVARAWRFAFHIAAAIALAYTAICFAFEWIYPDLDARTVHIARTIVPLLIVLPLIRTSNTICGNVLRAGGDAAYSLKIHMSVQWFVTVPLSVLFVLVLELPLIWVFAIMVIDELVKAPPFHLRLYSGRWKRRLVA